MSSPGGETSGVSFTVSKEANETSAHNVHFSDADSPWSYHVDSSLDATYNLAKTADANLGDFLSRPILIRSYQWTPSAQLFESFNPWNDYFSNTAVKSKMDYFRNFRCTLCLKVMLNGNSFYYGRALMSYNPYETNDDVTLQRIFFEQDIVGASQKPHVLLDPCSSQGAEMCLPFVYPENWFDITLPGWNTEMGSITIHDFDVLNHANGGTDPITVNVFAWAENVELCIPTTASAQSGEDDEIVLDEFGYPVRHKAQARGPPKKSKASKKMSNMESGPSEFTPDGLVSKPASAIASAANALTQIPFIAPYAKATSMVATRVGQIAKLFGYSRPQVLTDIQPYVPRFVGNITNTDTAEAVQKLSLDSKNELTIDSRVNGLNGADEMTIHSIASRESYFTSFDWPESAVTNDFLFSAMVEPCAIRTLSAAPVTEIHQTAISFASAPFQYWQGSIKYRFQVVCSEYHRGRLRIVYDPTRANSTDFNLTYSTVVDISSDRDFEYEVKWTQPRAWQDVRLMDDVVAVPNYTTVTPLAADMTASNGTLSVFVLNELATPSITPADVKVLVWVSAGDDFALSVPRSQFGLQNFSVFPEPGGEDRNLERIEKLAIEEKEEPQLEVFQAQAEELMVSSNDDSNAPVNPGMVDSYAAPYIPDDNQYLVYQGERVVSFRDLLRRYHYHESYFLSSPTTGGYRAFVIQNFPNYRGWDPNGSSLGIASDFFDYSYTFSGETLLNYLTPAFVCRRGAIRKKYVYNGETSSRSNTGVMQVMRRDKPSDNFEVFFDNIAPIASNNAELRKDWLRVGLTGSGAYVTPLQSPVAEIELPFYTRGQRFVPARDTTYNTTREHPAHLLLAHVNGNTASQKTRIDGYVSVGEDFNLSFFVGAPVMYYYEDPTAV